MLQKVRPANSTNWCCRIALLIQMKLKTVFSLLLLSIMCLQCIVRKKKDYAIPETVPMELREGLTSSVERGKLLYKQNCTGCHGIFSKGKDGVPDFSEQQIQRYSLAFLSKDPTSHAAASDLHPEQLNDVMTYLRYRILKNGKTDPDN